MSGIRFGRSVAPHQRRAVAWYQPDVLWTAGREVLSSLDQLRNRDLRESYQLPLTVIDRSDAAVGGDFWFDFIADTGDGGNATCAVAHAALADSVPGNAGEQLLRGELLLLGGDLAYPGASPDEYRYRFIEMFEGARRDTDAPSKVRDRPFTLAALAQNHDWMDSASTFSRYFIRNKNSSPFLGASIPQQQSYFCVKLPKGWWAFGLDFALTHDIDRDQYEQFEKLVIGAGLEATDDSGKKTTLKLGSTDRVVMIYPEPYWTRPIGDGAEPNRPKRYQRLEGLLQGRVALRLAGDLHHYLRWESDSGTDGTLVICGTGGAFTHPTHTNTTTRPIILRTLSNADAVPPEPGPAVVIGQDDGQSSTCRYHRIEASAYPEAATSRDRAWGNIFALFKTNGSWRNGNLLFAGLLGILYWFNAYLNSLPFIDSFKDDGFQPMWAFELSWSEYLRALVLWLKAMIFSPLGFVINLLMAGACMLMGRAAVDELSPTSSRLWRWIVTWGIGLAHALLHVIAIFSLEFGLQQAVGRMPGIGHPAHADAWAAIGHAVAVGIGMLLCGALVGGLLFGGYLALMSRLGFLTNNGYSALGIEDFKGFLRFRITQEGRLDAHFIGIDRVPRNWSTSGAGNPVWAPDDPDATPPKVRDSFSLRAPGPAPATGQR